MPLTRRQKTTMKKLIELYHEINEPLHYSVLAERLGVSKFTAYDMLRLLEEKGYVTSMYRLGREKSGPGRSEVRYMPTEKARRDFADLMRQANINQQNLDGAVEDILARLTSGELPESAFLQDILARIPAEENEHLRYCLEISLVIALRMQTSPNKAILQQYLPMILPNLQPTSLEDLSLMGGFTLAVLTMEYQDDPEWCQQLYEHVRRYKTILPELSADEQRQLGAMIAEIYNRFQQSTSS